MSSIRDRRKHQNRVEAIADALDLNHNTTTGASHALASAGVSSSDNATNLRSLSDGHAHTQAKDESTNQHLDLYRGATGENLCSGCNEIKDIFDFETGIPARSWRTLDLLARVDRPPGFPSWKRLRAPEKAWRVTSKISKTCSFCSFLMACASRMAVHTKVELKSDEWFLALGVRNLEFVTGIALGEPWNNQTPVLELKLCQEGDNENPFVDLLLPWKDNTHLILPVQPYDNGNSEVSDTLDWELIVKWLDRCHSHHDYNCGTDLTTTALEDVPSFCLIDCETETIIPAAEISNANYVTLSYVWGASTTTPQVLDASTSLPVLPESKQRSRVVNDAMEVVQRVGYRYLWVDRFCIPQSDHNIKNIQIKNMGKIYSMSALTIIAAAGNDAEYGLPGVGYGRRLLPIWTTIRNGSRAIPVIHFEPPNNDIMNSTWNSRGWTYQETLLSKRRLVFTDRHVYFQCKSMQSVGYMDAYLDWNKPPASFDSEVFPFRKHNHLDSWTEAIWRVIDDYKNRRLSYEEDTINAVQGILESFRDECYVWFFCGLPVMKPAVSMSDIENFHIALTMPNVLRPAVGPFRAVDSGTQEILNSLFWSDHWEKDDSDPGTKVIKLCSDRSEVRRTGFPSWTWAGWRIVRGWNLMVEHWGDKLYYIPDRCSFSIRLSYDDKDLSWPRDRRDIQQRSEITSQFPNFLVITGPVFDVTITYADGEDQHSSGSYQTGHVVWRYASPPFLVQLQSKFPRARYKGTAFSPEEVRGRTIHLVALTLFYDVTENEFTFHTLMLRPVGEDAHGQIYERVTCARFSNRRYTFFESQDPDSWGFGFEVEPDLPLADLNLRQMELRIR